MIATESGIRITSHAVGIVNIEPQADGRVLVDRMEYVKGGRMSVRHCMETGEAGETILDTLKSCFYEIVKDRASLDYEMVSDEPIYIEFGPDQNVKGGTHIKVWYAVKVKSALRDFVLPDGDENLGPITMVEANELLVETEGRTIKGHVSATYAAVALLAEDPTMFEKILAKNKRIVMGWSYSGPTPEEQAALDSYPGK